jgi:hypothetical protein
MAPKKVTKKVEESATTLREEKIVVSSDEDNEEHEVKKKPSPKQKKATKQVVDSDDDQPQPSAPAQAHQSAPAQQQPTRVKKEETESEDSDPDVRVNDKRVYHKDRSTLENDQQNRRSKHVVNSAINFNYNEYRELNVGMKDVSTEDALKTLITRAHDLRQNQLCETLKQTLRAMHFECNFPAVDVRHARPEHDRESNYVRNTRPDHDRESSYDNRFLSRNTGSETHNGATRGRGRGYGQSYTDEGNTNTVRGRGRGYGQSYTDEGNTNFGRGRGSGRGYGSRSDEPTTSFRTETIPTRGRGRGSENQALTERVAFS